MSLAKLATSRLLRSRVFTPLFAKPPTPPRHFSITQSKKSSHDSHSHDHHYDEYDDWRYRNNCIEDNHPATEKQVIVIQSLVWWWVLYHLYHEYPMVIGEWDYPDPRKWTDAQLGIPPDDFEE